ncbi:acyl-CoA dehydrogenase [Herbihabitans rhizosphaerae]|uniref:Acyl-CoA dehydrogenase n=1 Tax=Herbihabitans rhizosphaerae TaxID=1872711 RepID=A0A4Q7KGB1_9PSEU|nr:acyl-CoA dehydrogenase [Herbihabitans rhizosphaerae]RZS31192.1 acyl-CoA dehydrogenase [Herbihabitans rhizosphaerae]
MPVAAKSLLLNPSAYDPAHFDEQTRRVLAATVEHFEGRGLAKLVEDYHAHTWYQEFLDFVAEQKVFATFLTPARDGGGDSDKRWDTARVAAMSELLGFYGLSYWYPWQVTCLGLGPVWQSHNDTARERAAAALDAGGVAAFGLSEREHGADIYSTDMVLTPDGAGGFTANGDKYYIGNGNAASTVSVFGRIDGVDGPDQYVFFTADSGHPNYRLIQNVVPNQNYVSEFRLEDYPVAATDILHTGDDAFSAALNTVNVGKFNLCFGAIGLTTHGFYASIRHAHNRVLYGKPVTDMSHIRASFTDSYARLIAMKLFSDRAIDYFRTASPEDRRYLLFNPVTKMKVTAEGEKVMIQLGDVVAAKGFEKDNFIAIAKFDTTCLPRLEGTVAVNLALVLKFMPAYLFMPEDLPEVPTRQDAADDEFLFRQGPTRGLSKVRFHDWRAAFAAAKGIPNVALFTEQAEAFTQLLLTAAPDAEQQKDLDFLLALGEIFTLIVYGQLILEQAKLVDLDQDAVDSIFEFLVRDFSSAAVTLHGKAAATADQREWALGVVRAPVTDAERAARMWSEVAGLAGAYAMNPGPLVAGDGGA